MDHNLVERLTILADRQDILDCISRYCRGIDRLDRALALSAYHPDAYDDHGIFKGPATEFVDWTIKWLAENQPRHQHMITNHSVELDGDVAHAETYYISWGENLSSPPNLAFGRYIDQFERRAGRWAIAYRVCVNEFAAALTPLDIPEQFRELLFSSGPAARDKTDISYQRPLQANGTSGS